MEDEYHGVIKTFGSAVARFKALLSDNSSLIEQILGPSEVDPLQRLALSTVLQNIIRSFYSIHEYFVFLPREAVEREVFFALRDCFGEGWEKSQPSIILTSIYNAFEYRFEDVIKNIDVLQQKLPDITKIKKFSPGSCILELALIDRDSPLSWPILAHEFAHSIDDSQNISARIVDKQIPDLIKDPTTRKVFVSWTAEVFADLVAARTMGPIAILPIITMELGLSPILRGPSSASSSHPPTTFRSLMFKSFIGNRGLGSNLFENIWSLYAEDQDHKLATLTDRLKKAREQDSKMVEYAFSRVGPAIEVDGLALAQFKKENLNRSEQLRPRIEAREPIPSYRTIPDDVILRRVAELQAVRGVTQPSTANEVSTALDMLSETPAKSSEILTAGWLYKLTTYRSELDRVFHNGKVDFSPYSRYLLELDERLLKSLQLASVHQSLRKYAYL